MERAIGIITTNYAISNPSGLSSNRPVAAVPFAGRYRMVDFILSCMVNADIKTIGMVLPYNYRSIVDHISRLKDWSLDRKQGGLFFLPGNSFGSTRSGARFLIRDLIDNRVILDKADEPYVVLAAANIVMNIDIKAVIEAHVESDADVTVVCKQAAADDPALLSLDIQDGRVVDTSFGTKAGYMASLDCCVMSIEMLNQLLDWYEADDYMDLFEALTRDLGRVNVKPYIFEGPALPIFSLKSYYDNSMKFLDPDLINVVFDLDRPILTKSHDIPPAKYEPGAKVGRSIVSGGCRIAGTVNDSILSRLVVVEPGARVERSIILQSCVIGSDAVIVNAVIDKDNDIPAGTVLAGTPDSILVYSKGGDQ